MITVKPIGGLCNRIRTIESAMGYAQFMKRPLNIIWELNDKLNCPFIKLYEPINAFKIIPNPYNLSFKQKFMRYFTQAKMSDFDKKIEEAEVYQLLNEKKYEPIDYKHYLESLTNYKNIYWEACWDIYPVDKTFKLFKPIKSLQKKINEITHGFDHATVGVHIRRTDSHLSIAKSPISLFISAIEKEIDMNTKVNFFLATDDNDVAKEIKSIFGKRIITYHTEKSRNTVQGVQDALIDLYCLAKTNKIYGSYYSSYSETASEIGAVPLVIINKDLVI